MAIPLLTETVVAVGDLYDTGREYLENHRFRKCECHDARNVRTPATAISTLRDQNPVVVPTRRKWSLVLKGKQQVQIQIQQRKVIDTCMDDASFQCVDLGLSNDDLAIHCTKPAVLRLDPLIPIVCHCV